MSNANGGGTVETVAAVVSNIVALLQCCKLARPASCSQLHHHQAVHPGRELEQFTAPARALGERPGGSVRSFSLWEKVSLFLGMYTGMYTK
jgi:hypothetical protein